MSVKTTVETLWTCDHCGIYNDVAVGSERPPRGWRVARVGYGCDEDSRAFPYHLCSKCSAFLLDWLTEAMSRTGCD